ncbi:asp (abnormal spindle)-like, microcephaly associated-like protein [Camelus ferus]|nr:asp (abnormal spindle)-like, microcephaly associated-like protein [Camelus ferus]
MAVLEIEAPATDEYGLYRIPRHPMPFAAKNVFYDERWKEKQEQGFTWWLNFILTPDDFTVKTSISEVNATTLLLGVESQHKISVPRAPTKDEMSLRTYTARCRLNRLRRAACRLFTSEKMVKAMKKLEIEIEAKRLIVRKDRHLWKDVGERQKVLNWLLSYNPLWLRIGLERSLGTQLFLICTETASSSAPAALSLRCAVFLLVCVSLTLQRNRCHEEALSKFTLKKLLLLVCFLDYAKISRLIDHDPCLFCKDAEFKASKEILLAFSRDFLGGEGDLSRHLSLLGLPVNHVQTPFDEFDFAVTNLAVDLQCGVRLVRIMELLTRNWNLSKKLRIPAISRLQKMHNVDIVLQILKSQGIQLNDEHGNAILSKDIVDRHREKTLVLLWKIALAFQVNISLNVDQLKEEIDFLKHTQTMKRAVSAPPGCSDGRVNQEKDRRRSAYLEQHSESTKLLMDWVNVVCDFYNKKVENFTVSFSDGRVLCYLIHHYHPCYVPFDAICQRTTQTVECAQTGSVVLNSSSESDESSLDLSLRAFDHENTSELYKELLENEKKNFQLVRSAVRDLGGIPAMIQHSDMSNTIPDEKVVITYLSFLCARLLDLRKETRAARLIQTAWRKHKLREDRKRHQARFRSFQAQKLYKRKKEAILTLQKHCRAHLRGKAERASYLQKRAAALRLQAALRGMQARRLRRQVRAARVLQSYWRMRRDRLQFLNLKKAVIRLQAHVRKRQQLQKYRRMKKAALVIQAHLRAYISAKKALVSYQRTRSAVIVLQSAYRGMRARKEFIHIRTSIIKIQSYYRAYISRKKFLRLKHATVKLQSVVKMKQTRKQYLHLRAAALKREECERVSCIKLQAFVRGYLVRKQVRLQRKAAVSLQSYFRMRNRRQSYLGIRKAAVVIQTHYRAYKAQVSQRRDFLRVKRAVTRLQAAYRGYKARYRAYRAGRTQRHWYLKTRAAVVILQSAYRGVRVRREMKERHKAAATVQARYRAHLTKKKYATCRASAVTIQRWYRDTKIAHRQRQDYLNLRKAAVTVQAVHRGVRVRRQIQRMHAAATFIKAVFKMHQSQLRYREMRTAAVVIQVRYRAHHQAKTQRAEYLTILKAVILIQASFRGGRVRQTLRKMQTAATLIQSHFRRHRQQTYFNKLKKVTKTVQQKYRAARERNVQLQRYNRLRLAVICIQAAFRGMRARRHLREMHSAAALIQRRFRTLMMRRSFLSLRKTAVWIQRKYRANACAKHHLQQFRRLQQAAIKIQSSYRRWLVRKKIQEVHRAATVIQAAFRTLRTRATFQTWKRASILIQRRYRAYRAAKLQRELYVRQRRSAVVLQAAYRGMRARQLLRAEHRAAVIIQSTYRMHRQYSFYQKLQWATKLIQEKYRANKKKALQHNALKAAACVQADFQDTIAGKQIQEWQLQAAITVQKHFKAFKVRKHYLHFRAKVIFVQRRYRALSAVRTQAAVCIQSHYRGFKARAGIQRMHLAATRIQSSYRMHRAKADYQARRTAIVVIQNYYRSYVKVKMERKRFLAVQRSVRTLQAAFRGMKVRQKLKDMPEEKTAALTTQPASCCSGPETRRETGQSSALGSPRLRGAPLTGPLQEAERCSQRKAAVTIQKAFRKMVTRKLETQKRAAVRIQSFLQMAVQRRRFVQQRRAAVTLQQRFRTWQARKQLSSYREAAVVLKSHHRAFLSAEHQREVDSQIRSSVIIIQARMKGFLQKRKFQKMKDSAIKIQTLEEKTKTRLLCFTAAAFYHLSALRIQRAYKLHVAQKNANNKQVNSAICIQALWRGYSWRKKNDCTKMKAIRQRLQCVNREIREENKLYHRTALALHHLLTYKYLSAILEALKHLEVVTRLSSLCCENMAESGAISKIFVLIRSCNRSVPCMEVIGYAVQVLLNVAKYEKTASAVYEMENCIDTLLELLQMYQEKPGDKVADKSRSIFTKTCCLLAVLLKTTNRASVSVNVSFL